MLNALLQYQQPGIRIGTFTIYAYAIIIVCGMIAAFFLISLLFRRRNMSKDLFLTYFCVTLPIALFTTRLFYCITDRVPFEYWFSFTDEVNGIRGGGLSIIGGILGGTLGVVLVSYFKKANFFRAADCIVVGLLLAQAIGRWGNFANQEVYGAKVTNEALQFFPFAVYINKTDGGNCLQSITLTFQKMFGMESSITGGTWHYAFFFYESILNLIAALLMFLRAWKNPKKPNGINVAWYFIHYGLVRSIMEPLRDPSYILNGGSDGSGIQWSFVFSLLMLIGGAVLLFLLLWFNRKKEGTYIGSANGDPYGITAYVKDNKKEIAYLDKINMMCKIFPENYVKPAPESEREGAGKTPDDAKNEKGAPISDASGGAVGGTEGKPQGEDKSDSEAETADKNQDDGKEDSKK